MQGPEAQEGDAMQAFRTLTAALVAVSMLVVGYPSPSAQSAAPPASTSQARVSQAPVREDGRKLRVLVDTDANNELDDQHALAYLLFNGGAFDLEGITVNTTRGGGDITQQVAEARRVLTLCTLQDKVPLKAGANGSFTQIRPHLGTSSFDGADAVNFIIERAHATADSKLVLLPIGKLTNIALALVKDPSIAAKVRIVWLGSNYPAKGEYNQENDLDAVRYVLSVNVPFEIATVRYGQGTGTDAVRVTRDEIAKRMPGKGPRAASPVTGRHGGTFTTFGDYSVNLFEHIELDGNPPSRALFDMAAAAILKNPKWARREEIPAPRLVGEQYVPGTNGSRRIVLWTHFDREAILADFFATMDNPALVGARAATARP
jgi:inosine-uridine nucleoside N-ribohydrolase